MEMTEFMKALRKNLNDLKPRFPNNAESILDVLYDTYNEHSCFENEQIKADFEELYQHMNGKPLQEMDGIIYAVCTLCRDHERAGFMEGVKVGMSLIRETC